MKRIIGLLIWGLSGAALAQVQAGYVSGQVLTAGSLNFTFNQAAAVSNGTLTNPTITGGSITGLASPLSVASGGTSTNAAGGTALDNITGFVSTGFLTRTGAGAYAFQSATNGITLGNLAQAGANTVLANATGGTANVTAFAVPSCSTSASALNWTSGTGLTCNTAVNAAQLGGATFAAPGAIGSGTPGTGAFTALSATGAFTPSQTSGIVGTTTNNNANAGSFGEYQTASPAAVNMTSGTAITIASISLTAGDWDVSGVVSIAMPAGVTLVRALVSISTTNNTLGAFQTTSDSGGISTGGVDTVARDTPMVRISVASTTTVYLVSLEAQSGAGQVTGTGFIRARRVR